MTDIDMGKGLKSRCINCLGMMPEKPEVGKHLRTVSFGFGPDEAFFAGVVMVCDECHHIVAQTVLMRRIQQISEHLKRVKPE